MLQEADCSSDLASTGHVPINDMSLCSLVVATLWCTGGAHVGMHEAPAQPIGRPLCQVDNTLHSPSWLVHMAASMHGGVWVAAEPRILDHMHGPRLPGVLQFTLQR
jgi:hypothetical protein